MRVDITNQPAYSIAYVKLAAGESVFAEPGAMVALSAGISVVSQAQGGLMRSALRRTLGSEAFFQTCYTSSMMGAWVALAPKYPGDIAVVDLQEEMRIQSGSMLGYADTVEVSGGMGTLSTVIMREGVTVLKASGHGTMLLASYGGIDNFTLGVGESMIVDTGHLVAWSASCTLKVGPIAGPVTTALSDEWLVGQVTGPGRLFLQTRSEQQFRSWLFPEREQNQR